MATIRILLGIFCLIAFGGGTESDGGILDVRCKRGNGRCGISAEFHNAQLTTRNKIIGIANSQIGIRELTGHNDGAKIEAYLKATKLGKGNPWCAAFVSWVFKQSGLPKPRTAWSPDLFPLARQTLMPKSADILGIYSVKLKRIAHCGVVERRQNNWIISIEGNTNLEGSREGDGVYRKWRHIRTIAKFANWVQ